MIRSFRHRGLKALYDGRTTRRVAPEHLEKLRELGMQMAYDLWQARDRARSIEVRRFHAA